MISKAASRARKTYAITSGCVVNSLLRYQRKKSNEKEFDILFRPEKYFMYLSCKNTAGAFVPCALDFQKLVWVPLC